MLKRWNFLKTGFYEGINLAEAIVAEGKDYVIKLKKTNPSS